MNLPAASVLLLLVLAWPGLRRSAAAFFGGNLAMQGAGLLVLLGVLVGLARGFWRQDWVPAEARSWILFAGFVGLIAAEASPAWIRLLGFTRMDIDVLQAWIPGQPHPQKWAFLLLARSLVMVAGCLMLIWLLFYLLTRPEALRLPGLIDLHDAAPLGWPVFVENAGVRVLACLAAYAIVVAPGTNGSARWVHGTRIQRVAAGWLLAALLAVSAATGAAGVALNWVAAGLFAGFSAYDISFSVGVLWLFLRAIGVGV